MKAERPNGGACGPVSPSIVPRASDFHPRKKIFKHARIAQDHTPVLEFRVTVQRQNLDRNRLICDELPRFFPLLLRPGMGVGCKVASELSCSRVNEDFDAWLWCVQVASCERIGAIELGAIQSTRIGEIQTWSTQSQTWPTQSLGEAKLKAESPMLRLQFRPSSGRRVR